MNTDIPSNARIWICTGLLTIAACGGREGTLTVLVEAEDVIIGGLQPGDGVENIRDGWRVAFERYVVVLGDIEVERSNDPGTSARASEAFAVDLVDTNAAGQVLWELGGLESGRWNFGYSTLGAGQGAQADPSVDPQDFARMQAEDLTYLLAGAITRSDGVSCPPPGRARIPATAVSTGQNAAGDDCYANPEVSFSWGARARTQYGPCEIDGIPGFSVPAGGSQTVAITIHGDHVFFNGFPEGSEGGSMRLAQWLADCDLDLDGTVTREELEVIRPSDLTELDDRFQLGGAPLSPLDSMWTYVAAQLATQGHFQGEGECPIDDVVHDPS